MEVTGLVLAVPPLIFLCLDVLDRVENYRKYESHERQLNARFSVAKARLQKWSNAVGVTKDNVENSHLKCLNDPVVIPVLYDLLNALYQTFDDVTNVNQQLGQNGLNVGQAPSGWHPVQRTKSGFKGLRESVHAKRTALSWALRGKAIFTEQVEMFESLVDGLYDLLPLEQVLIDGGTDNTPASMPDLNSESERIAGLLRDVDLKLAHLHQEAMGSLYSRLDKWLKTPIVDQDFENYSKLRAKTTCDWIFNEDAYIKWRFDDPSNDKAKFLWIHGPPGFGKTVLCAVLTARFKENPDRPTAYFFSSPYVQSGAQPTDIIRSWISQLARANDAVLDLVGQELMKNPSALLATQNVVWRLLHDIVSTVGQCTLVLDGYDEFPRLNDDRQEFLQKLKEVVASTNTRVLVASRPQDDINSEISSSNTTEDTVMAVCQITPQHVQEDVRVLAAKVVAEQLPRKEVSLQQEISNELSQNCNGQFLWIKLLKSQLRPGKSKKQLFDIVAQTPHGLTETYQRHWDHIQAMPPDDCSRAVAILRWVCFAVRTLTVEELTEALVHEPDIKGTCEENMPDEIDDDYIDTEIKVLCPAFIDISNSSDLPASRKIQIIHQSAREFLRLKLPNPLESSAKSLTPVNKNKQNSVDSYHHMYLAENCLRYINCDQTWKSCLDERSAENRFDTGFMKYADSGWDEHMDQAGELMTEGYERLTIQLFDPNRPAFKWWANNPRYWDVNWTEPRRESGLNAAIYLAVWWGLPHVLRHFYACTQMDFSPVSFTSGDALSAAASHGSEMFESLLSWGANPHSRCGVNGSPLGAAVVAGNVKMALALLMLGADLEVRDSRDRSVLALACQADDLEMIQVLLDHGADPSDRSKVLGSPLFHTISNKNIAATRLLLDRGAKLPVTEEDECSHLHHACRSDCSEIVKLLLEKGVDLEIQDDECSTPLLTACGTGSTEIVRLLLESGANKDHQTSKGVTPLYVASWARRPDVVRLLLDKGAVVDRETVDSFTSFIAATQAECTEAMRLLLDHGADMNHRGIYGATAMHVSAIHGLLESARFLLEQGADIDMQSGPTLRFFRPLHFATASNDIDFVQLLIEEGAPVNSQTPWGLTPLWLAIEHGNFEMVEKLVNAGANINVMGDGGQTLWQHINKKFPGDERIEQWRSMARLEASETTPRTGRREDICIIVRDLLKCDISDRLDIFFTPLYYEFKFLGAKQDATFVLKQQVWHDDDENTVYHLVYCDGCQGQEDRITGDRWACFECLDRDYCSACKENLPNSERADLRECAQHEMIRIEGMIDKSSMDENGKFRQNRAQDPIVRQWLTDLLKRYGPETNSNASANDGKDSTGQ